MVSRHFHLSRVRVIHLHVVHGAGKVVRTLTGHTNRLGRVAFHPMGQHLVGAWDMGIDGQLEYSSLWRARAVNLRACGGRGSFAWVLCSMRGTHH